MRLDLHSLRAAALLWIVGTLATLAPTTPALGLETRWEGRGDGATLLLVAAADEGLPNTGSEPAPLTLAVALPERGGWRVQAFSVDGRPADPARHLRLGEPGMFRRVRLGKLAFLPPERGWERAEIRLAFDAPLGAAGGAGIADPLLAGLLVNEENVSIDGDREGGRAGSDFFDGSGRWLRLDVARSGVYRLDYDDLQAAGIAPGTSTAGFRLLGTGGKSQPFRLGWGGSWGEDWEPTELPIQVVGGATVGPDTELRFYLPGADGFEDEFTPGADFEAYRRNAFANHATYHLTWGGADGLRVQSADASPQGGETDLATLPARVHREENQEYSSSYLYEDGWAWRYFFDVPGAATFVENVSLDAPAAGEPARLRIGFDAPTLGNPPGNGPHHVEGYISPQDSSFDPEHLFVSELFSINTGLSMAVLEGEMPLPADLEGSSQARFTLRLPRDEGEGMEEDYGWLLWYEFYHAMRPRTEFSTPLELHVPADQARARVFVSGWSHEPEVWDLTDPTAPVILTGGLWAGDSLGLGLDTSSRRRLMLVDAQAGVSYRRPDRVLPVNPRPLRNDDGRPQMVVVCFDGKLDDSSDQGFMAAGERYAEWRRGHFPDTGTGEVEVVGVSDIYANFSGGMQDLAALRNFLKYRYEAPDSRLAYVLLLGDTTTDYRNFYLRDVTGDVSNVLVPALSSRFLTEQTSHHYTTDDYFAYMDVVDDSMRIAVPDLAMGRMPAPDRATADLMVDAAIDYERDAPEGIWRNRMALATDDYTKNCHGSDGIDHTGQAENLVRLAIPAELDLEKIYMCEWDCDFSGFKPHAQNKLFETLDEGVLIFNYVGHGGNDVLSDEQLLLTSRLPALSNAGRRFFFISASCNVGKFDDTGGKSMSEEMLSMPQGGAIGTMASSALSSAIFNNVLNRNFIQELFPERQLGNGQPIGAALLRSKIRIQTEDYPYGVGHNNERYSILGDPALRLSAAGLQVAFDESRGDTLQVGEQLAVSGRVLREGALAADFQGELLLSVRASADTSGFIRPGGSHVAYHLAGPEIYRGRIAVEDGQFSSPAFFVPGLPDSALGGYGRIRAYATSGDGAELAVGVLDSLAVAPGELDPDDTPPDVRLRLAGGATHGTPGMALAVAASAQSGINLVGIHPQNAIFVEYVESGEVQNLTDAFEYDLGSASTGSAQGNLPAGLPMGLNTLVASVADNLGNVGRDTLRVEIFEEGRADLTAVQPFPNPFDDYCAISFELTAAASVRCDIYTVSGRRIRTLERDCPDAGRWSLDWDGRDGVGHQVASGTYLYRMEAVYHDNAARKRQQTGAIVRMRD